MVKAWRRIWAIRRVKQGDGSPLQRYRWWQLPLGRALFHLRPSSDGRRRATYAVDVRHWGNQSGGEKTAHLHLDGRHHAQSKMPAVFPVENGVIEVATSGFGIKRCHYVTTTGEEHQLVPDPKSGEGGRARLERDHPTVSRVVAATSMVMLVIGVGLNLRRSSGRSRRCGRSLRTSAPSPPPSTCRAGSTSRSPSALRWPARRGRCVCATTGCSTPGATDRPPKPRLTGRARTQHSGRKHPGPAPASVNDPPSEKRTQQS